MIADKVKKNIEEKKLIDKGDMVVLGLSGGPDSVCLFSILQGLRDEIGFEMSCVHVNHMLRGKDAEADLSLSMDAKSNCPQTSMCSTSRFLDRIAPLRRVSSAKRA